MYYELIGETQDYNVARVRGKYEVKRVGFFNWQVMNTPIIFNSKRRAIEYKEKLEKNIYYVKKEVVE